MGEPKHKRNIQPGFTGLYVYLPRPSSNLWLLGSLQIENEKILTSNHGRLYGIIGVHREAYTNNQLDRNWDSIATWAFILPQMPQIALRIDEETPGDAVMIRLRVLDPVHAFFPDLVQYRIG